MKSIPSSGPVCLKVSIFKCKLYDCITKKTVTTYIMASKMGSGKRHLRSTTERSEKRRKRYGSSDSFKGGVPPLQIFPEELWLKIFDCLDNEEDVVRCMLTCKDWGNWLEQKRERIAFSKITDRLAKFLPKSEFLKCRQVCKSWKAEIDDFYENHPLHLSYDHLALSKKYGWKLDGIEFLKSVEIEKFMGLMSLHPSNPFPGRCLMLKNYDDEEYDDEDDDDEDDGLNDIIVNAQSDAFWKSIKNLLERFGEHVWYIYIDFNCFFPGARNVEETLRDCLVLLPNLRKLNLDADILRASGNHAFTTRRVKNYFLVNPLDGLQRLECLSLNAWNPPHRLSLNQPIALANPLHPEIIKSCQGTLKKANFTGYILDRETLLPNLEETKISVETVEHLHQLECLSTDIVKITIEGKVLTQVSFQHVFEKLERFGSLKFLDLGVKLSARKRSFKPKLPSIEDLSMSVYGPLDFLTCFKELKRLVLVDYESRRWGGARVQTYGFENKMLQSNIWDIIPTLNTLVFRSDSVSVYGPFDKTFLRKDRAVKSRMRF